MMTEADDPLHAKLKARLEELNMSPEEASRKAGLDKTYLRKLFERPSSRPRLDTLEKLARSLFIDARELLNADFVVTRPDGATVLGEVKGGDVTPAGVELPHLNAMATDLPVLGTAAGSARGAFQLETANVVDYVRRPPALTRARNAYALFVQGESMIPEHNPGDLRFVNPDRPARIGDSVVVQAKAGEHENIEATIGHYLKMAPNEIIIGKLNPKQQISIARDTVIAVHKVLTMNDLFGV